MGSKDLINASRMAGTAAYPFLDAVLATFHAAVEAGRGQADWSVVNT